MDKDSKWLILVISLLLILTAGIFFALSARKEAEQERAQAELHSLHAVIQQQEQEIQRLRLQIEKKDK